MKRTAQHLAERDPRPEVKGSGSSWSIMHDGRAIAGPYTHYDTAIMRLTKIERRLRATTRACLRCGSNFHSEGIGNRMCAPCRRLA